MIKIICGWCGRTIREGAEGVKLVTRLICTECYEKQMRELDERLPLGKKAGSPEFHSPAFEDKNPPHS